MLSNARNPSIVGSGFNIGPPHATPYTPTPTHGVLVHNADYASEMLEQAFSSARKIAHIFKINECVPFANGIKKALTSLGVSGRIVKLEFPMARNGLVVSRTTGEAISENGVHWGVVVGGKAFDPVHPGGLDVADWLDDFVDAGGVRNITEELF
ncbi:MAG: hypothetical protein KDA63_14505 [Planctomycetales bacterium]|nr:hypothetical protein [Planctomycetales bacterium]